mmetsp:Transcript_41160/g.103791  ORF Transcript_41160/g.103791 Transcript_41160/m.103791 type:complete len:253 (+) Transcript_41160:160-918(+)
MIHRALDSLLEGDQRLVAKQSLYLLGAKVMCTSNLANLHSSEKRSHSTDGTQQMMHQLGEVGAGHHHSGGHQKGWETSTVAFVERPQELELVHRLAVAHEEALSGGHRVHSVLQQRACRQQVCVHQVVHVDPVTPGVQRTETNPSKADVDQVGDARDVSLLTFAVDPCRTQRTGAQQLSFFFFLCCFLCCCFCCFFAGCVVSSGLTVVVFSVVFCSPMRVSGMDVSSVSVTVVFSIVVSSVFMTVLSVVLCH